MKIYKHIYIIILFSAVYPNGMMSDNYFKSINYSFGYTTDNESYYDYEVNDEGVVQIVDDINIKSQKSISSINRFLYATSSIQPII